MRVKSTKDGVTLRVIAGTNTTILGIDLESSKRKGCLGFSIRRFDLGPVGKPFSPAERKERWLPNMLKFPSDPTDPEKTAITTLTAPLQKFSWTDNTCSPGFRYRYQVVPRYGRHEQLTPANITAVTLPSALHDFQGHLLEGKEGFRHAGVHIHSKIILADPLGPDPILIMGSANFSHGSTRVNDSNSVVFRGDTAVADIYASEFMRVFGSYHFRAWRAHKLTKLTKPASGEHEASSDTLGLQEDDSWSEKYYVAGSQKALERMMFAGTM